MVALVVAMVIYIQGLSLGHKSVNKLSNSIGNSSTTTTKQKSFQATYEPVCSANIIIF